MAPRAFDQERRVIVGGARERDRRMPAARALPVAGTRAGEGRP